MRTALRTIGQGMMIALALTAVLPSRSDAVTWTNGNGGNWSNPANWNTGAVPAAGDNVNITLASFSDVSILANVNYTPETALGAVVVNMPRPVALTLKLTDLHSDFYAASETIGTTSHAEVTHSGHTTNGITGYLTLGSTASGEGTYTMGGLALSVGAGESIGYAGSGNFTQTSGTHSITGGDLRIGELAGSYGVFTQTGGTLNINGSLFVGVAGTGSFNQNGGVNTSIQMYVAGPVGANNGGMLTQTKGAIVTGGIENHGTIDQAVSSGTLRATFINNYNNFAARNDLTVTSGFYNVGTALFGGAQHWSPGTSFYNEAGNSTFTSDIGAGAQTTDAFLSGGKVVFDTTAHLRTLAMMGSGKAVVAKDTNPSATPVARFLQVGTLSFTRPGTTLEGQLDLTTNNLIVDTADAFTIRQYIASGYAGGAWTGTGIISSAADARHGLGYVPYGKSGQFVRLALNGDANLDSVVNFDDLLALARAYNGTFTSWVSGDFTYDGATTFDDLLALARNYGLSGSPAAVDVPENIAADWALAQSLVPEPAFCTAALLGVGVMVARRRHAAPSSHFRAGRH